MRKHVLVVIATAGLVLGSPMSTADAETADAAPVEALTVVLLPAHVHVVRVGIKMQPSEEWTAAASATIDAAVQEVVGQSTQISGREPPSITPDERATIDEMMAVATLVQFQEYGKGRKSISRALRAYIDRALGPSLAFLHERAGADYALITLGTQAEQGQEMVAYSAAGVAASVLFPPLVLFPSGTLSYAAMFLVDLRTGQVRWFNGRSGHEIGGYNFTDLRDPVSARKVVSELLQPYPEIPPKLDQEAAPTAAPGGLSSESISPVSGGFGFYPPAGWQVNVDRRKSIITSTLDGRLLNEIKVQFRTHPYAFPESGQRSSRDSSPEQLAQWYAKELQSQELADLQIRATNVDAQLAGRKAFRVHFSYRMPAEWGGARVEHVTIGTVVPRGLLLSEFSAPGFGYFARSLPVFEQSTQTIVIEPRKIER
jgi:hypothetical protein